MKTVSIIGIGMSADTVTQEGMTAIRNAQVLLGARRMVENFASLGKVCYPEYAPERVKSIIKAENAERFAILVSGDIGFYSATAGLTDALAGYDLHLIPGISSMVYFLARLGKPWQNVSAISCHGRNANLADTVRRSRATFALTGGNVAELSQALCAAGYENLDISVGENLGMDDERIFTCTAQQLTHAQVGSLAVIYAENSEWDDRCPTGLPDECFIRGEVPMTKSEVRTAILSKLALRPGDVCADLGAGTGSVTVEMALSAWRGHVYAPDRNEEAVSLIRENCRNFHIGNVTPMLGDNLEILKTLPALDAAFIGGSGGEMGDLVSLLREKNPHVRIVISAIALESVTQAIDAMTACGIEPEIVQLSVSRARKAGKLHLMMAQNPIYLISGGGKNA